MSNEDYPQWEYKTMSWREFDNDINNNNNNKLGKEGWEVTGTPNNGQQIILKRKARPKPSNPSYGR